MPSQHYRTYKRLSVARLFVLFIATFSIFLLSAAGGVPTKLGLGFSSKSTRVYSGNHAANAAVTVLQAGRVTSQKNFTCAPSTQGNAVYKHIFLDQPSFPIVEPDQADMAFLSFFSTDDVEQRIGELVIQISKLFNPRDYYVIDAGMNRGFFTMLSSRLGYSVIAFELSPECICKAAASLDLLGLRARVQLNMAGLSQFDSGHISLGGGCNAGQSVKTKNNVQERSGTVPLLSLRTSLSRNTLPQKRIALLKMDIEGSELDALLGFGTESFPRYHVQNIIVETASHLWGGRSAFDSGVSFFEELAEKYAGVYCLDPNLADPSCSFETENQVRYQGQLYKVMSMSKALDREGNHQPAPCCGNIWFKDLIE